MTETLFSQGFKWGDDDGVADLATPAATSPGVVHTRELYAKTVQLGDAVAGVATVAETEGQRLERALSQRSVAGAATGIATPETAVFGGLQGGAGSGVASVASVAAWRAGVASMVRMVDLPAPYHSRSWRQLIRDARRFLDDWGDDAVRFGWSTLDVFGSNPVVSHRRLDRIGLVALLNGDPVHAIDADSASIGRQRDMMTYRRTPLGAGSVAIWEMRGFE